jgi:hypothetical protein
MIKASEIRHLDIRLSNLMPSSWITDALNHLSKAPAGYHPDGPTAAEPSALAALALLGANRIDDAAAHLNWLAENQLSLGGSVPPFCNLQSPGWSTPIVIVAAAVAKSRNAQSKIRLNQAQEWLLSVKGTTLEKCPEFGHDGMLVGWPWVIGTHSWQEPTAWSVLALKSLGMNSHPRTHEGVRLLVDRLLPEGGCNYGNTYVLGQKLRPQVEPSGLTLLALAGEDTSDPRIDRTIKYVASTISDQTTPITLSYGLLGLTAHHRSPADAAAWLESAYNRSIQREPSAQTVALLVLAAQGEDCPLVQITKRSSGV